VLFFLPFFSHRQCGGFFVENYPSLWYNFKVIFGDFYAKNAI